MSMTEILKLSVSERIELVQDIWDSIAGVPEQIPLTEAQQRELDRRHPTLISASSMPHRQQPELAKP